MTIERALKIEGWMSEAELTWLAEQAAKHSVIVELGSHLGRSTAALAENTPGVVFAVDHWYGPNSVPMAPWDREKLYDKFIENMNGLIESKKVIPVRCNHQTVKIDVIPDMVFIDGDHEYESVKIDLEKWKHAKFLCGHDASHKGVRKALEEIKENVELIEGTDIWVRL